MYNIHIINRYYPPNPAVTGEDACKMAAYLMNNLPDITVSVYYINTPYFGGGSRLKPVGRLVGLSPVYRGRNKPLRLLGNFVEGFKLIRNALKKADVIISLTDPPLINYWSGSLHKEKGVPWVYWSLDIYPDAFAAAGLVGTRNPFYKYFAESVRKNIPDLLVALGNEQAKFLQTKFLTTVPHLILPCGIHNEVANTVKPEWRGEEDKIYFGYAGNLSEAHSHDFLLDFINCLDVKRHRCILALYGARAQEVISRVKGNPSVQCVPTINRRDLFYIDVHLVTLKPEWTHICVPSKAVSAVCAGGTILFYGLKTSDTWQMFKSTGWIIDEFQGKDKMVKAIRAALDNISDPVLLKERKDNAVLIKSNLLKMESDAYKGMIEWIEERKKSGSCCRKSAPFRGRVPTKGSSRMPCKGEEANIFAGTTGK